MVRGLLSESDGVASVLMVQLELEMVIQGTEGSSAAGCGLRGVVLVLGFGPSK